VPQQMSRKRGRDYFQHDDYMGGKEIDLSKATDQDRWAIHAFNNSEDQLNKKHQSAKSKADAYRQQHGFDQYGRREINYGEQAQGNPYAGKKKKEKRAAKVNPLAGMSDKEKKRYKQQQKYMKALNNKEKQLKERHRQTKLGLGFDYNKKQFDQDGNII